MSGGYIVRVVVPTAALLNVRRLGDLLSHDELLYQRLKFAARIGGIGSV